MSGNQKQENQKINFPEDSIQSYCTDWWVKNGENKICRGALVFAFLSHVDQVPYGFKPCRADPHDHDSAEVEIKALNANGKFQPADIPVAAMLSAANELWVASRAKLRPCIVLSVPQSVIEKQLTKGKPNANTAIKNIVVPYYGVSQYENRAGYHPELIERIKHLCYPEFFWDILPIKSKTTKESLLRFDHLQPIGYHHQSYKVSDYKLSENALEILESLLTWVLMGDFDKECFANDFRTTVAAEFGYS